MPAEPRRDARVAGILLAAGTASRMGSNKLLMRLDGESLLRRAARAALAGGIEPLLVVVGHEEERARGELAGLDCQPVVNPIYQEGIATSLKAGVRALPAAAGAAVVMLADMPLVSGEMIAALVARWRAGDEPLVISEYDSVEGPVNAPPMLYDRALFGELLASDDGRCGRQVVKRHRHEAGVLPWPESALADVDVPDDAARLDALAPTEGGR